MRGCYLSVDAAMPTMNIQYFFRYSRYQMCEKKFEAKGVTTKSSHKKSLASYIGYRVAGPITCWEQKASKRLA